MTPGKVRVSRPPRGMPFNLKLWGGRLVRGRSTHIRKSTSTETFVLSILLMTTRQETLPSFGTFSKVTRNDHEVGETLQWKVNDLWNLTGSEPAKLCKRSQYRIKCASGWSS
ncbi:hypothetical protein AVEN_109749-1 [Araneus ventricosus]|uniref:Uncharacterized protein n=1 Tax=Araneus ventricosus TaxID=182803 RepID=A0A4Y2MRM8_ARAVE|nr:hypothetical protein AVEN_109749-1 [Araneus ventricosus]